MGFWLKTGVLATLLACAAPAMRAQTPAAPAPAAAARPRLVVLLVVDQFPVRYVEMYGKHWTDGLHELLTRGAFYTQAAYPFASTKTCAGHATISTGTLPATHGQIDNEWFDPVAREFTTCTEDPRANSLVYAGKTGNEHHSARLLKVPTFADELLRQSGGRSRVVSLAVKARSSIMMGGRGGPNTTFVWSEDTGGVWTTSTALARRLAPDVDAYVRAHPVDVKEFETWNRVADVSVYQGDDQAPGEPAATATFPHVYEQAIRTSRATPDLVDSWESTPFPDKFVAGLAAHLVQTQKLGQRDATDMVDVSFSALDTIGHRYGPNSHEVQDVLLRLDKIIGDLLRSLDTLVGRDRYVLAFSSDHGVAPMPEQVFPAAGGRGRGAGAAGGAGAAAGANAAAQAGATGAAAAAPATTGAATGGRGAGAAQQEGRASVTAIGAAVEGLLDKQWGRASYVEAIGSNYFYFRPGVLDRIRKDPATVKAIETALSGTRGIAKVYWASDLAATTPTDDPILVASRKSYVPGRSGDLFFVLHRNWVTSADANHGTPYDYDTRVPLVFYGRGITAAQIASEATPADIVPTLSALTGIRMPKVDGKVLKDVAK